jgi:hypothetical protein
MDASELFRKRVGKRAFSGSARPVNCYHLRHLISFSLRELYHIPPRRAVHTAEYGMLGRAAGR